MKAKAEANGIAALKKERAALRAERKQLRQKKADPIKRTECQVALARVNLQLAEHKLAKLQTKKEKKAKKAA